jgi:hypothetical protein
MSINFYFASSPQESLQMPTNVTLESYLRDSVRQLIQAAQNGERWERRQHVRYSYHRPVTINLDHSMQHFSALTREISQTGVGLLHEHPVRTDDVISMTMQYKSGYAVTVPMVGVWCRPCGAHWYISNGCFRDVATNVDLAAVEFTVPAAARHQAGSSHFGDPESMPTPTEIFHLLNRNFEGLAERRVYDPNLDRRCEERYDVNLPVTATPVDNDLQPVGDSFDAVTCDISSRGITLFGHRKLNNGYLTLQVMDLDGQTHLDAVIEVLRCQPIGAFHMIAGRFQYSRNNPSRPGDKGP